MTPESLVSDYDQVLAQTRELVEQCIAHGKLDMLNQTLEAIEQEGKRRYSLTTCTAAALANLGLHAVAMAIAEGKSDSTGS